MLFKYLLQDYQLLSSCFQILTGIMFFLLLWYYQFLELQSNLHMFITVELNFVEPGQIKYTLKH